MNKPIRWLLALNIVLITIWGAYKMYNLHKEQDVMSPEARTAAAHFERSGALEQGEMLRHMTILHQIGQSQTMSDSDLDWGINLIHSSASRIAEGKLACCTVLFEWRAVRRWTPSQHEKVFQSTTSLLQNNNDDVRSMAIQVLVLLKDARAVSYLLPLLDNPKPDVQKEAQHALAALGHKP